MSNYVNPLPEKLEYFRKSKSLAQQNVSNTLNMGNQ